MVDIPAGVLALVTLICGAITGAIAYVFKQKDAQILRLEAEVAAGRLKIDALQDKAQASLQTQLEAERKRTETDQRVAGGFADLTALVKGMAGKTS